MKTWPVSTIKKEGVLLKEGMIPSLGSSLGGCHFKSTALFQPTCTPGGNKPLPVFVDDNSSLCFPCRKQTNRTFIFSVLRIVFFYTKAW